MKISELIELGKQLFAAKERNKIKKDRFIGVLNNMVKTTVSIWKDYDLLPYKIDFNGHTVEVSQDGIKNLNITSKEEMSEFFDLISKYLTSLVDAYDAETKKYDLQA